jgi:hypothetical protein
MKSTTFLLTLSLVAVSSVSQAVVRYVDANSTNPLPPYTTWATAAATLQDAAGVAVRNDLVLVTNGVYASGGKSLDGVLTNRVVIPNDVTFQSVNGPDYTFISGHQVPGTINGIGAVRCVYMNVGAVLSGFTVTNGATLVSSPLNGPLSGGGIYCVHEETVTNCIISGNSAYWNGGGVCNGFVANCVVQGNSASYGGGINGGTADSCHIRGNSASGGGGACGATLVSCEVSGNSAEYGGGVWFSTGGGFLEFCTITGNSARQSGGVSGGLQAYMYDCIIFYNKAVAPNENYDQGLLNGCCTTPLPTNGVGDISVDPELASLSHLSAASPCREGGPCRFLNDIDGETGTASPPIGCDKYIAGSVTGALSVAISAAYTNSSTGFPLDFTALIDGRTSASSWDFGDGTIVSNHPYATHIWTQPGGYTLKLTAYNETFPEGISASLNVQVLTPATHYVSIANANPLPPYDSWATAATDIQSAVDSVSVPGDVVLVNDGIYDIGGRAVFGTMTNRVVVDKPITVQSLNGPSKTMIVGSRAATAATGDGAIRCVYLADGATLSGFTLTNGATRASGNSQLEQKGAAAWCPSLSPVLTNCVLIGNAARLRAGGSYGGTLRNCVLANNSAEDGGGVYYSSLTQCVLTGNTANFGGGAYLSTLSNCDLAANSSGAYNSTLNNCISYFNTNNNYSYGSIMNCCTLPLPNFGASNFTNDPAFVDVLSGDLRLQAESPCINSGNNTYVTDSTDLEGNPRIKGGTVDVGVYEFQTPQSLISYAWLQSYGLPADGSADFKDSDGDGMDNRTEFLAGTDPTNSASSLCLLTPTVSTAGVVLTWQSALNRTYTLERAIDLAARPCFSCLATNIVGSSGTTSFTDTNSSCGPMLYRIQVH